MKLQNIRISTRLTFGFAFVGLLMLLQGIFTLYSMHSMHKVTEQIDKNTIPSLEHLAELNLSVMRMRVFTLRLLIARSDAEVLSAKQSIREMRQHIGEIRQEYEPLISVSGEQQSYDEFSAAYLRYTQLKNELTSLVEAKNHTAATELANTSLAETANQMAKALLQLNELNSGYASEQADQSEQSYLQSWNYVIGMVLLSLLYAAAAAVL